jgi:hypothetical protein
VFQLAFDNAVRPEVDDVLELILEMYQYNFDFRLSIKHSVAQLKQMATKLKPFGIIPGEPGCECLGIRKGFPLYKRKFL